MREVLGEERSTPLAAFRTDPAAGICRTDRHPKLPHELANKTLLTTEYARMVLPPGEHRRRAGARGQPSPPHPDSCKVRIKPERHVLHLSPGVGRARVELWWSRGGHEFGVNGLAFSRRGKAAE
jgi:hypothetical protein